MQQLAINCCNEFQPLMLRSKKRRAPLRERCKKKRKKKLTSVSFMYVQSGASSQAKHGGAYFSAVRGSIEDPIAVPGRHEVPRV